MYTDTYKQLTGLLASETLTGVTQLKIGDISLHLDVRMSFCTLTLTLLCLLEGRSCPIFH